MDQKNPKVFVHEKVCAAILAVKTGIASSPINVVVMICATMSGNMKQNYMNSDKQRLQGTLEIRRP